MKVSVSVAYRIYQLETQTLVIAFNTGSKNFMFLDGLSAELFALILEDNQIKISQCLEQNELTEADIIQFMQRLQNFGFFDEHLESKFPVSSPKYLDLDEANKHEHMLNTFQNKLRKNGFYYCFHIDLTNCCNEKCIHCYHPFSQYDYSKELSLKEVKRLIDIVFALGVFSITLSGGECMLR